MIPENELRVGNTVIKDGRYIIYKSCMFDSEESQACDPVLLTPEILERCGFTHTESEVYDYNGLMIYYNTTDGIYCINGEYLLRIKARPEYLHQLQNLYFALTGEEL